MTRIANGAKTQEPITSGIMTLTTPAKSIDKSAAAAIKNIRTRNGINPRKTKATVIPKNKKNAKAIPNNTMSSGAIPSTNKSPAMTKYRMILTINSKKEGISQNKNWSPPVTMAKMISGTP